MHLSIIVIVFAATGINSLVFAQVLPVPVFETAYFKSDHGTYPIPYQLINGTLINTPLDLHAKGLFFEINTTANGQLTVELPRSIIDSKNGSQDKPYYVTIANIRSLGGSMRVIPEELSEKDIRILQINFPQGTSEIGISGTYFAENYPFIPQKLESPLNQFKSGIAANDVKCEQSLQLVIKSEDDSPACVTSETSKALAERGWSINPKSTIMHVELDQPHYPPNNLDYDFIKGMIYTASGPIQNSTVSILGNNIPIGNAMTDSTGCFQFDSWNNTEINQEMFNASNNHQESYTLKITTAYPGDGIHYAVNDTKSAVVYFRVFPIPPPFYVSSTNPPTVQVKQGESANLELFVRYLVGGPVGPMDMTIQRLPCGVTFAIPSSNHIITSINRTFNISIKTQDYTRVGKYHLDVIQDTSHLENTNFIPDPYIGMINLEVLPK
jgi:hypothetical protein